MTNSISQNHIKTEWSHDQNSTNLNRGGCDDTGGIVVNGSDLRVATGIGVQQCAAVAKPLQQHIDGSQLLHCNNMCTRQYTAHNCTEKQIITANNDRISTTTKNPLRYHSKLESVTFLILSFSCDLENRSRSKNQCYCVKQTDKWSRQKAYWIITEKWKI